MPGASFVRYGAISMQEIALGQCAQLQGSADPETEDWRMSERIRFHPAARRWFSSLSGSPGFCQGASRRGAMHVPWFSPRRVSVRGGLLRKRRRVHNWSEDARRGVLVKEACATCNMSSALPFTPPSTSVGDTMDCFPMR